MKQISANITGSFILNGVDLTTTIESSSIWSGSIASRVSSLEQFSSSLDATYATDVQLNAVTQSVNTLSSSFLSYTSSTDDKIAQLNRETASLNLATASLYAATASLYAATASINSYTSSNNASIADIRATTASLYAATASINNYTSSNNATVAQIQNATASLYAVTASINSYTASNDNNTAALYAATASLYNATASIYGATSSLFSYSASATLRINALDQYTASLNTRSASFACVTATNNFACTQYFSNTSNAVSFTSTGSLYSDGGVRITRDMYVSGTAFFNNVTVFGTQSINYISSSQLNIASNIISVNTATPTVRFGGLAVYDSGSLGTGLTGSILWDSEDNQWIYSNPSGSTYDSALFLVGPRNTGVLGNEPGISCNFLSKGNGMHHMTSSGIFEDGSRTCFYNNSRIDSSGNICNAGSVCSNNIVLSTGYSTSATASVQVWQRIGGAVAADMVYNDANTSMNFGTSTAHALNIKTNNSTALNINSAGVSSFFNTVCAPIFVGTTNVNTGTSCVVDSHMININGDQASVNVGLALRNTNISFPKVYGLTNVNGNLNLYDYTANSQRLRIDTNGIACFACQVCLATQLVVKGGGNSIFPWSDALDGQPGMFAVSCIGSSLSGLYAKVYGPSVNASIFGINSQCVAFVGTEGACNKGLIIGAINDAPIYIGTNNSNRLIISNTGISTFSCQVCAPTFLGSTATLATAGTACTVSGVLTLASLQTGPASVCAGAAIVFEGNGGSTVARIYSRGNMNFNNGSDLVFQTQASAGGTPQCTMVINGNTQNVGIGTFNPTCKLEVDGGSSAVGLRISTTNPGTGVASLILANSSKSAFNDGMIMTHGGGYTNITSLSGASIMAWDMSTCRVGIGTTSPSAKLHVFDSTTAATTLVRGIDANLASSYTLQHGGGGARTQFDGTWYMSYGSAETDFGLTPNLGGGLVFWFNSGATTTNPMTLKRSGAALFTGNVGIGVTSPTDKLHVLGTDNGITICSAAANRPVLSFINGTTTMLKLSANGTYGAIADNTGSDIMIFRGGSVGVNTTDPKANFHVCGSTATFRVGPWFSTNDRDFIQLEASGTDTRILSPNERFKIENPDGCVQIVSGTSGGVQLTPGATSWASMSDRRKKKNFETTQGLAALLQIEPVKYHFEWDNDCIPKRLGFIAQNIQPLIPEMVKEIEEATESCSTYLTITPDYLLPVLVKSIQEQQCTINTLKTCLGIA